MTADEAKRRLYVMTFLRDHGASDGRTVRDAFIRETGQRWDGPAFYLMTTGLEVEKRIEGWYEDHVVRGAVLARRCFRLTDEGRIWLEGKRSELSAGPQGTSFTIS